MTDANIRILAELLVGFCTGTVGFCFYQLYRNARIYNFRIALLERDYETYHRLPSYDRMMAKFWVWPLSKFLLSEEEKEKPTPAAENYCEMCGESMGDLPFRYHQVCPRDGRE